MDEFPRFLMPVRYWKTPATDIPEQTVGNFRILKRIVKAGTAWPMYKTFGYDYGIFMNDAVLTLLQERVGDAWRDWMVDSPYEWYAMVEYAMRTEPSNVLVGGLGLGLILNCLADRKDLDMIKVVEINTDVINMISPHLPRDKRIEIIQGDFFKVVPKLSRNGETFNTVIVDIWAGYVPEYLEKFKEARDMLNRFYPKALHLFHPFQKKIDTEIICKHLGGAERLRSIRFIPRFEG